MDMILAPLFINFVIRTTYVLPAKIEHVRSIYPEVAQYYQWDVSNFVRVEVVIVGRALDCLGKTSRPSHFSKINVVR